MSEFEVLVVKVVIGPHDNADRLEIAQVGDFRSIVLKDQFKTGDLAAYIPEASLVPSDLLKEMNLWDDTREPERGKLSGRYGNRVKPIRLRGVFSEGICIVAKPEWNEGDNVAEELGIEKYEPPIPGQFQAQRDSGPFPLHYDIENIKKFPDRIEEGEPVIYTEKIHGTFMTLGIVCEDERKDTMIDGKYILSSKGLISRGTYIKDVEENAFNGYMQVAKRLDLGPKFEEIVGVPKQGVSWIMGEVFGIQKGYRYGCEGNDTGFRVFDIKIRNDYLDWDALVNISEKMGLQTVPSLAIEPFSKEQLKSFTNGRETISGKEQHIREGVVVRPLEPRRDRLGRRIMYKSVSEKYLLKSTGEEIQ